MEEQLTMRTREIDRLKVIHDIFENRITWKQAAEQVCVTERQIGRICARVRIEGNKGMIHGLGGKPSHHQLQEGVLDRALRIVQEKYADFGPTFANEKLRGKHGIMLSVNTLRSGMILEGLWKPIRGGKRHRAWRERRFCLGELVQLDGSEHAWFEDRGKICALVIYIDDATSEILWGEFIPVEDTLSLMGSTKRYLEGHGRPVAFYVDKDSVYKVNRAPGAEEELQGESEALTQFRRAMNELGIDMIYAQSPQAKGRVERSFRTHQDRLVKELRLAGISTMPEGNEFLWKSYIPNHNRRYSVEPANEMDAHRALLKGQDLLKILSIREPRVVAQDFTVRWKNEYFQIEKEQLVRVRPKVEVKIEQRIDGTVHLRFQDQYLNFKRLEKRPYRAYHEGRTVKDLCDRVQRPQAPAMSHPWKARSYQRMLWKKARKEMRRAA